MANFQKKMGAFFFGKENSEFTTEISFCEFGFFSAKKKSTKFSKVRRVGSQVHQKIIQIGPHPEWTKKIFRFLLGSACSSTFTISLVKIFH